MPVRELIYIVCVAPLENRIRCPITRGNLAKLWKKMYASANPRQWDYGCKTATILEEPCDLEHLVVSVRCPPNL
jgi:hypothetical protein